MRYHYERKRVYEARHGSIYICGHAVYSECTLYKIGNRGLAVIQQRFDPERKSTMWTAIDPWLVDEVYLNENFKRYFDSVAKNPVSGIYPTVTIRKLMWALRMKPIRKKPWETTFDRKLV